MATAPVPRQRLDKWLWHARFFKTRTLAAAQVAAGHVRVNGQRVTKAAQPVGPGDVLTFAQAREVRVIRVEALGQRRGPATEARSLYADLAVPTGPASPPVPKAPGFDGRGRPDKRTRRQLDLSRRQTLE